MSPYGLIIGFSIIIGYQYFASHNNLVPKKYEGTFVTIGVILAIIGARTYHVIDKWSYYSQHLNKIPVTWNGGLGIYGAIITALIYLYLYSFIKRTSYIKILDLITPILPLCQSIGRLGNFINHEISTWWLESGLCFALFLFIQKFPKNPTAKYLIGYGLIRFTNEFFRNDTWTISGIKIAQLISIIFVLVGIKLIRANQTRKIN